MVHVSVHWVVLVGALVGNKAANDVGPEVGADVGPTVGESGAGVIGLLLGKRVGLVLVGAAVSGVSKLSLGGGRSKSNEKG